MSEYTPVPLKSKPGVMRDGTQFAAETYLEYQWVRSYQGLPRKMGGYRQQVRGVDGVIRQFNAQTLDGYTYIHAGAQTVLQRYTVNNDTGAVSLLTDRSPAGFIPSDENGWQFTNMFDTASSANLIFASAVPNISQLTSTTERPIYYGLVQDVNPLVAIPSIQVSGGVVALVNYLVAYGNDGVVRWSVPGVPLDFTNTVGGAGSARPCATKIVRGLPLRGSGGPAALLWSLDSLVVMQWVGGAAVFSFDTITASGSVLSSNGIIENNGIYYWATTNGFSMFNGVLRDLPNEFNKQWFLKNLNWSQRQKVFAFKIPKWTEIWWCFPLGDAEECTHAVIYNYGENVWYDTLLPPGRRSAGQYAQIYEYPIMACAGNSAVTTGAVTSNTWQMEVGTDLVRAPPGSPIGTAPVVTAIPAWFVTNEFNYLKGKPGASRQMSVDRIEPDFEQSGPLTLTVQTRMNTRAPVVDRATVTFQDTATDAQEQTIKPRVTGRLMRFKIESNVTGGDFVLGETYAHIAPSDGRVES